MTNEPRASRGARLTHYILAGLVLGLVAGYAMNVSIADPERLKAAADWFTILTDIFLRLIKMIIAPLVFATLVTGIAHMGDTAALGRIGARTLGWFIGASFLSLTLGLLLVNLLQPGAGLDLPLPAADADAGLNKSSFNLHSLLTHIFPTSIVDAMARNEILQIVVFSVFIGVALTAVGDRGKPIVAAVEALASVMLKVTDYVMRFAPVAVFAAVAHAIAVNGIGVLATYAKFVGAFYLGLVLLWLLLFGLSYAVIRSRARRLFGMLREPVMLAFSTASSEAAYPRTLEALDAFGVPRRIASFVLPLGYSFNLDGSMLYMTFATLFIAQAYGIEISAGQQILMVLTLMITSKGIAGVPRASLVVIAAVMGQFGIPEAGLLLILAVDHFLDMGRSATNVIGNAVATAVVARWEGKLDAPEPIDAVSRH
ncbi:MAG: dicarboxylate/amino acid:cation symporter [Steroidobacteraceae bacterium]